MAPAYIVVFYPRNLVLNSGYFNLQFYYQRYIRTTPLTRAQVGTRRRAEAVPNGNLVGTHAYPGSISMDDLQLRESPAGCMEHMRVHADRMAW